LTVAPGRDDDAGARVVLAAGAAAAGALAERAAVVWLPALVWLGVPLPQPSIPRAPEIAAAAKTRLAGATRVGLRHRVVSGSVGRGG
jgi:hypothetical protein